jgi:hypothetical protein
MQLHHYFENDQNGSHHKINSLYIYFLVLHPK